MMDMDSIYREQANAVFKYLMTLCYEEDTAQELTQETFYQAVKSADKYNGSCKVSTWLCQIAKHLWYQELDRRKEKGPVSWMRILFPPKQPWKKNYVSKKRRWNYSGRFMFWRKPPRKSYFRLTGEFSFGRSEISLGKMKTGPG